MRLAGRLGALRAFRPSVDIQMKLALASCVLGIIVAAIITAYGAHRASSSIRDQLRSKLSAVAASVAANIDVEALERIQSPQDETSADYRSLKSYLQAARNANPEIRYVYTIKPEKAPTAWHFLVDAEENPALVSHVGDRYDVTPYPEFRAAVQGPTADKDITTDKWGRWLSGYSPVRERGGKTIAVLGLDMSAEAVAKEEARIMRSLSLNLSLLAAAFLSLLFGILLSRHFTRPIQILAKCTERVAQGDLEVTAVVRRGDELGDLATRFNQMVQRLRESQEKLLEIANSDALTGLPNHRRAQELLAFELERAARYEHAVGVVMLDVDNFKLFNDSYGHLHGDEVLRVVAKVLTDTVRSTDIVARYGGDEFILILPEIDSLGVTKTAQRILSQASGHTYLADNVSFASSITCSIGSALYPSDSLSQSELVDLADAAMYEVKRRGGNGHQAANVTAAQTMSTHSTGFSVLGGLVQAVDRKDRRTKHHSETVMTLSSEIAERLLLPDEICNKIRTAALLHDVGKIGIPDNIIRKRTPLSEEEEDVLRQHAVLGATIIQEVSHLADEIVVAAVRHHHERFDGTGYPRGLRESEIPLAARIIAVANEYWWLTAGYHGSKTVERRAVADELNRMAGAQLDPEIVAAFLTTLDAEGGVEIDAKGSSSKAKVSS
ncbi:MAG: diguanylate cyclase [Chloroflexi bacterium]|nr:diguanylate cyclase [Chloroflexota bacterium]